MSLQLRDCFIVNGIGLWRTHGVHEYEYWSTNCFQ